jgi:hypothetical protein
MFNTQISLGDIVLFAGFCIGGASSYFGTLNKIKATDYKIEELRRGRGLILEHWPHTVQRCFGWRGNGNISQD